MDPHLHALPELIEKVNEIIFPLTLDDMFSNCKRQPAKVKMTEEARKLTEEAVTTFVLGRNAAGETYCRSHPLLPSSPCLH